MVVTQVIDKKSVSNTNSKLSIILLMDSLSTKIFVYDLNSKICG